MSSANKSVFVLLALLAAAALGFVMFSGGGGGTTPTPVEQPKQPEPPPATEPEPDEADPALERTENQEPAYVRTEGNNENSGSEAAQGIRGTLLGPDGGPVAGADLYLVESLQANPMAFFTKFQQGERFTPVASTMSREDGTFELGVTERDKTFELMVLSKDHADHRVRNVKLMADDWYDAGQIFLDYGVELRGVVTSASNGITLADAEVSLSGSDGTDRMYSIPGRSDGHTVRTDDYGAYSFPHIQPGFYTVTVVADNHAQQVVSQREFKAGQQHELNFQLQPGMSLAGTVMDPEGAPVEGAQVTVRSLSAKAMFHKQLRTDHEGRFDVIGVSDAPYQIRVESSNYQPREVKPVMGGSTDIKITLEQKAAVRIQVTDSSGRAITRYRLAILQPYDRGQQLGKVPGLRPVAVGARRLKDGAYTYTGLDQGRYIAQVEPLRNGPKFAKSYSTPFEITGGGEPPLVQVTATDGASAFGRLVDPNGNPIAGATVKSNLSGIMEDIPVFGALAAAQPKRITKMQVKTGADGSFRMEQLSGGKYQFEIDHPAFCRDVVTDIQIGAEQEVDLGVLQLSRGCVLTGVASVNGAPQGQLKVVITEPMGDQLNQQPAVGKPQQQGRRFHAMALTDNQGQFQMDKRIPPGVYEIYAQRQSLTNPFEGMMDMQNTRRTIQVGFQEQMQQNVNIPVNQ